MLGSSQVWKVCNWVILKESLKGRHTNSSLGKEKFQKRKGEDTHTHTHTHTSQTSLTYKCQKSLLTSLFADTHTHPRTHSPPVSPTTPAAPVFPRPGLSQLVSCTISLLRDNGADIFGLEPSNPNMSASLFQQPNFSPRCISKWWGRVATNDEPCTPPSPQEEMLAVHSRLWVSSKPYCDFYKTCRKACVRPDFHNRRWRGWWWSYRRGGCLASDHGSWLRFDICEQDTTGYFWLDLGNIPSAAPCLWEF